jgi:hypothetical protein
VAPDVVDVLDPSVGGTRERKPLAVGRITGPRARRTAVDLKLVRLRNISSHFLILLFFIHQ